MGIECTTIPELQGIKGHELKAAILLFYGLLDEQQRGLFAGLESMRLGHGLARIELCNHWRRGLYISVSSQVK
jgi:hypothetical protein